MTSSQSAPRTSECALNDLVHVAFHHYNPRSESLVVANGLEEWVRLLKHHADALADLDCVDIAPFLVIKGILLVVFDLDCASRLVKEGCRPCKRVVNEKKHFWTNPAKSELLRQIV